MISQRLRADAERSRDICRAFAFREQSEDLLLLLGQFADRRHPADGITEMIELLCQILHFMDQLFCFLLLADIACKMYEETVARAGIIEDKRRHIDPDSLSGSRLDAHVEIGDFRILCCAFEHAATLMADSRAEGPDALQNLIAALALHLFSRI